MKHLLYAVAVSLAVAAIGCDHHNLVKQNCGPHQSPVKPTGGVLHNLANPGGGAHDCMIGCRHCGLRARAAGRVAGGSFCKAGRLGWQRGGLDYIPRNDPGYYRPLQGGYTGPPGPPTAAYAYPYYTTRGPRDFFLDNPPTIGP